MPTNVVKKWAKESGISFKKAEEKWETAKEKTKMRKNKSGSKWAYTMSIFKKMMKKENYILNFNQFNENMKHHDTN
jgi:hypothetical protein